MARTFKAAFSLPWAIAQIIAFILATPCGLNVIYKWWESAMITTLAWAIPLGIFIILGLWRLSVGHYIVKLEDKDKKIQEAEKIISQLEALQQGNLKTLHIPMGIEYYASRHELPKINNEFENVKNAWVLWYTGYGAKGYNLHRKKDNNGVRIIERIILLNPSLNYQPKVTEYLVERADYSPEKAEQDIKDISWDVLRSKDYSKKINIKWLNIIPNALYVINNPNGDDAWVRVEVFDLDKCGENFESYRIYKKEHPWIFNELKSKYEELWAKSDDVEIVGEQICVRKK